MTTKYWEAPWPKQFPKRQLTKWELLDQRIMQTLKEVGAQLERARLRDDAVVRLEEWRRLCK